MIPLALLIALFGCAYAELPDNTNCGDPRINPIIGNEKEDGRIVGGREAIPHSWPWQGQLLRNDRFICGGSLVSHDWVVTAAHCISTSYEPSAFSFRFGRHTSAGANERFEQVSVASTYIVHEAYDASTTNNDIAVVRLAKPVVYTSQVSPVCLPRNAAELPDGELVHITGWGNVEDSCCAGVLKQVEVPIYNHTKCNEPAHYNNKITDAMICAGLDEGGLDSCQGDSGGPLVAQKSNLWYLYGIVSWGYGCADPNKPGVYTNVVKFEDWIFGKIAAAEAEEAVVAGKFRPVPSGSAFRKVMSEMVRSGKLQKKDLPMNGEWME